MGMNRSDFVALCLARHLGMEEFAPRVPLKLQVKDVPIPENAERVLVQSRPHRKVMDRIDAERAQLRMFRTAYVELCLVRYLGMEEFAPPIPAQRPDQEVLPLGRTA